MKKSKMILIGAVVSIIAIIAIIFIAKKVLSVKEEKNVQTMTQEYSDKLGEILAEIPNDDTLKDYDISNISYSVDSITKLKNSTYKKYYMAEITVKCNADVEDKYYDEEELGRAILSFILQGMYDSYHYRLESHADISFGMLCSETGNYVVIKDLDFTQDNSHTTYGENTASIYINDKCVVRPVSRDLSKPTGGSSESGYGYVTNPDGSRTWYQKGNSHIVVIDN